MTKKRSHDVILELESTVKREVRFFHHGLDRLDWTSTIHAPTVCPLLMGYAVENNDVLDRRRKCAVLWINM